MPSTAVPLSPVGAAGTPEDIALTVDVGLAVAEPEPGAEVLGDPEVVGVAVEAVAAGWPIEAVAPGVAVVVRGGSLVGVTTTLRFRVGVGVTVGVAVGVTVGVGVTLAVGVAVAVGVTVGVVVGLGVVLPSPPAASPLTRGAEGGATDCDVDAGEQPASKNSPAAASAFRTVRAKFSVSMQGSPAVRGLAVITGSSPT